jgi:hypothetical protein
MKRDRQWGGPSQSIDLQGPTIGAMKGQSVVLRRMEAKQKAGNELAEWHAGTNKRKRMDDGTRASRWNYLQVPAE